MEACVWDIIKWMLKYWIMEKKRIHVGSSIWFTLFIRMIISLCIFLAVQLQWQTSDQSGLNMRRCQTVALFQTACKTMSHSAMSFFSSVKMCLMETLVRKSSHVMNGLRRSFLDKDTEYTCIFSSTTGAGENRKDDLFDYVFPQRWKQRLIPSVWSSSSPLNLDWTSSLHKIKTKM